MHSVTRPAHIMGVLDLIYKAARYVMVRNPFSKRSEGGLIARDAGVLLSEGRFSEAEDKYKKSISTYRWSLDPYIGLSVCLIRREDIASAEGVLASGARIFGRHDAIFNLQTRCFINSNKTENATASWLEWKSSPGIRSYDFYAMAAELLAFYIKNKKSKNITNAFIDELLYQSDDSVPDNLHPSLAYILFHNHEHNRNLFSIMLDEIKEFILENGINQNKATLSTHTVTISFNLLDNQQRNRIIKENLFDFSITSHLPFVLMGSANCSIWHESLKANRNTIPLVIEKINSIDLNELSAEDLFKTLIISDVCSKESKSRIIKHICNNSFDEKSGRYENALCNIKDNHQYKKGNIAHNQRLRIAVCVSGQMRGWRRAFKSWDRIGLNGHDVTYFIHTWSTEGGGSPVPPNNTRHLPASMISSFTEVWNELGEKEMLSRYRSFFSLWGVSSGIVTKEDISNVYASHHAIIDDDADDVFTLMNNPHKMYYKIFSCNKMMLDSNQEFDLVARIRPDIEFTTDVAVDWVGLYRECSQRNVVYAESSNSDNATYMFPNIGYAMSDFFAISTPEGMNAYSQSYAIGVNNLPSAIPSGFEAHRNVAYATLLESFDVEPILLPHQFIPSFSPDIKSIKEAIEKDSEGRNDAYDRMLISCLS